MARCLVTGGAGFIGSHTVDLLLERGYSVRILDNLQPRVHPQSWPSWVPSEAEFVEADVTDRAAMRTALDGVDTIVHLAAYQDYMTDFSTFFHVNTESAALLFELIVEEKFKVQKIVLASSQAVCGEGLFRCAQHGALKPSPRPIEQLEEGHWEHRCPTCELDLEPLPIDESVADPISAYGISKYALELIARRLGERYAVPTVCMRYTHVQGPRNSFFNAYSGVARIFALRLIHGLPPLCYEDGQQLRDWVNVRDVARANLLVLEDPRADFQVFNVGSGRLVTLFDFATKMAEEFGGTEAPVIPGLFRVGDTRHTVPDIGKLRSLGWEPEIPVEQNIKEYLAWIQEQPDLGDYFREAEATMAEKGVLRSTQP